MKKAIKIEDLPPLDSTAVQVLRIIAVHLGDEEEAFVDYEIIGKSLKIKRDVVSKAVKRMEKKQVVKKANGKLRILNVVNVAN